MPAPVILLQVNDFTSLATYALKINLRTIIKHFRRDYLPAIWTVFHPHDRIPLEGNGTLICPLLSILIDQSNASLDKIVNHPIATQNRFEFETYRSTLD